MCVCALVCVCVCVQREACVRGEGAETVSAGGESGVCAEGGVRSAQLSA